MSFIVVALRFNGTCLLYVDSIMYSGSLSLTHMLQRISFHLLELSCAMLRPPLGVKMPNSKLNGGLKSATEVGVTMDA